MDRFRRDGDVLRLPVAGSGPPPGWRTISSIPSSQAMRNLIEEPR